MEELKKSAANLASQASAYVNTLYDHTRVNATIKVTNVASESLMVILTTGLMLFCFLFIGIGSGIWIGHAMNNMEAGFFIVAGAYLLIAIIFLLLRKQILMPFKNLIVKKIYE